MLLSTCSGDTTKDALKLSNLLQEHVENEYTNTLTVALFGNDATLDNVLNIAQHSFPQHITISSFSTSKLKFKLSQFAAAVEDYTQDPTGDEQMQAPLIILDNFTNAGASSISSLHQAWERERPFLKYKGNTFDFSSYIWLILFRGESMEQKVREIGYRSALEKHWSSSSFKKHQLTSEAAVGRISSGFVLNQVSKDWVAPDTCKIVNVGQSKSWGVDFSARKQPTSNIVMLCFVVAAAIFLLKFLSSTSLPPQKSKSKKKSKVKLALKKKTKTGKNKNTTNKKRTTSKNN